MVTILNSTIPQEYLQFELENHRYYIDISCLDAVRNSAEIVEIPQAPEFIKGITIYEDDIIPVICVKKALDLGSSPLTLYSPLKIMVIKHDNEKFGVIIDKIIGIFKVDLENSSEPDLFCDGKIFALNEILSICQRNINNQES